MASRRRGAKSAALGFPLVLLLACSSSTPSAPESSDASAPDVFVPTADTGAPPSDAGPSQVDATGTCAPANVQGYVPRWTPPKQPQGACTSAQLAAYGECLDSNDPKSTACTAWAEADAASSACKQCVADSKQTDPSWGPLVDVGTTGAERILNVSGCLAIVLHDSGSGCAGSFQALQGCEAAACADNCQGTPSSAIAACTEAADSGGCSSYLSPAVCVYDAGASAQACFGPSQGTFGQKFAAIAAFFCVGADGGP